MATTMMTRNISKYHCLIFRILIFRQYYGSAGSGMKYSFSTVNSDEFPLEDILATLQLIDDPAYLAETIVDQESTSKTSR